MEETVARRCSVKKIFLENSQNSQENTCARVSFFVKFLRIPFLTEHLWWLLLNGSSFTSTEFKNCIHKNGIRHIAIAPCHASSNGSGERTVQTFESAITITVVESIDVLIKMLVSRFLFSYRNIP